MTLSRLRKANLVDLNGNLVGWSTLSKDESILVLRDLMQRMRDPVFVSSPTHYLSLMRGVRGKTTELRIPEDISLELLTDLVEWETKQGL